jgi:two-component system LytT family response regulator
VTERLLRAFVVDDERLAVDRLVSLLEKTGRIEIVGSATDPVEALSFLQTGQVDLLFLDIQMPELTGFDLLERLGRDIPVIFTTAYDQYAIDAFTVNSIDYLLKPVSPVRLDRALDKLQRLAASGGPASAASVRALARELATQLKTAPKLDRIASRVGERTTLLETARITHFFSKDKLTFAMSGGRSHAVSQTLNELEERLDSRAFLRIHRATIVNLAFVRELHPGVDGMIVRLKDDAQTELAVARDRVRLLKERLGI